MSLIVQKFGGTSVADCEKISAAARKAIRAQQQGNRVIVVVSAMGHETDRLVDLAEQLSDSPPSREMDMLLSTGEQVSVALMAIAIHALGHKAVSLTGAQMGIKTDSTHTKARIRSISTERINKLLDEGNIIIAAGFQGIDENFNITTLGRGGSDTTAVALAAAVGADVAEIYTDVDGVYTTDPRVLPEARKVNRISYDEMLELASLGAGVMHSRSIEFGKKFGVPIQVRSSFSDVPGTLIVGEPESSSRPVSGAAVIKSEARISVFGVPDVPGTSLQIFSRIAAKNISVDMIVQNVGEDGRADISFTVPHNEVKPTLEAVEAVAKELKAERVTHDLEVAKVSVVGLGMAQQTGVANRTFRALSAEGINIQVITTSEIKISVLVDRAQYQKALRAVHQAFELDKTPADAPTNPLTVQSSKRVNPAEVVARLQGMGMEELTIDEISLDQSQARATILGIPDEPGVAARIFDEIAGDGIFVDMIVQSIARDGRTALTVTVPRDKLAPALKVLEKIAASLPGGRVTGSSHIAKLSVSGIGLRSNTGVAIRMFQALSEKNINVDLINTSEVRVNMVVEAAKGEAALEAMKKAFSDVVR